MSSANPLLNEDITRQSMLEMAHKVPLDELDVSNWHLFEKDAIWPWFERLRREDPVHYHRDSRYGPFWSVTKFDDIKAIDKNHQVFSSQPNIGLVDSITDFETASFISMDPPKHDVQRKVVSPVVAPSNLAELEPLIRERVCRILDNLPVGTPFNWVDRVSIELTTQMLATLFDFPFEERSKLTYWSDMATRVDVTREERQRELLACLARFTELWHDRADQPPGFDLISMLTHGEDTKDLIDRPMEYLGNLTLLIVGGNDTTRNSISGGVLALNQFPAEYDKLRNNIGLIRNMVAEIIRWQTPLAFMRRTALEDCEFQGRHIRQGDKVVMWYVSGNRDETHFERADELIIDRPNARQHISFGFGIHLHGEPSGGNAAARTLGGDHAALRFC